MMNSGSCLCKAVKVNTEQMKTHISACHCNACRKWGGASLLAANCGNKVIFEGEENIGVFNSSAWAERGFCKLCGTHLFYRLKGSGDYSIPVGLFDNDLNITLHEQFFIEEKPNYYSFAEKTIQMTGAELFAKFGAS